MALGRGLDSLIPKKTTQMGGGSATGGSLRHEVRDVSVDSVHVNPHQPRKKFDHKELEDLINSIRVHGILQPLLVTRIDDNSYQLIAGERRLRAGKVAGLQTVPVIIREAKEQEKLELALIENVQRKNLNAYEEALSYQQLIDDFGLKQQDIASRVGKSRSTIANTLRVLELSEEIRDALMEEKITEGHARALLAIDDLQARNDLFARLVSNKLSVREVEDAARKVTVHTHTRNLKKDPILAEQEVLLRTVYGSKVKIVKHGDSGEIRFPFHSSEDLGMLFKKLSSQ